MNILITGAAGMIAQKLLRKLAVGGRLQGQAIQSVCGFDVVPPFEMECPFDLNSVVGDLSADFIAEQLIAERPDVIFHLAAIVSGEAEADFAKGYRINLDGTRQLFDVIAAVDGYAPRVVFTSSIAVYGAPFPDSIPDDFHHTPLTSYGTQKAICELLLNDYSRRGLFDGIGIRLPTICVRPGQPNQAASGFFSNIIREPIAGKSAVLPVEESVRHWHASPEAAVGFLIHAAELDTSLLDDRRNLTMPGISVTVAEQIQSLRRMVGDEAVQLIQNDPDPAISAIVANWPQRFSPDRATSLGFKADSDFDDIIRIHLNDSAEAS